MSAVDIAPASARQKDYLLSLARRRALYGVDTGPEDTVAFVQADIDAGMTKEQASTLIDDALKAPAHRKPGQPVRLVDLPGLGDVDVPEGFYALTDDHGATRFYQVGEIRKGPHWGQTGVYRIAGDRGLVLYPKDAAAAVTAILADPLTAAWAFADLIGKCYRCGRTLTDDVSRMLSIGPNCRGFGATGALRSMATDPVRKRVFRSLTTRFDWNPLAGHGVAAAAAWTTLPGLRDLDPDEVADLVHRAFDGDLDPVVSAALLGAPRESIGLLLHSDTLSEDLLTVLTDHPDHRIRDDAGTRLVEIAIG